MGNSNGRSCGSIGNNWGATGFPVTDAATADLQLKVEVKVSSTSEKGSHDVVTIIEDVKVNKNDELGVVIATALAQYYKTLTGTQKLPGGLTTEQMKERLGQFEPVWVLAQRPTGLRDQQELWQTLALNRSCATLALHGSEFLVVHGKGGLQQPARLNASTPHVALTAVAAH